jgi:hypothetical protein
MSDTPARPQAPTPNLAAIPAELIARAQWVCWRYQRSTRDAWTKVPIDPNRRKGASHSDPSTWATFADAVACYQQRPDLYDGIGYVFAADDPYVGGDIDDSLDTDRVPPTYAEISPSGNGIKWIARADGDYGRKTARGELYSSKRFFTLTGNVLPGHDTITACQDAVDVFAASLGPGQRTRAGAITDGTAGRGSRAELAAQVPAAEWEDARRLLRTQINRLLARVRAAAREGTQLAYLLRGDYPVFHHKWGFVGLYRADGSLDDSQVRAVAANGIRGRGFTFPEYVALMTHLYAAAAVAKWGTKQAWREELAALWHNAPAPGYAPKRAPKAKAPRGRAGDHAALVERVYQLLLDHRAGAEAIVQIADLAAAIGAHRRTVTTILNELRASDHISTRRFGQYGGLIVAFSDVIYSRAPAPEHALSTPQTDDAPPIAEETKSTSCVSSDRAESDHISPAPPTLAELVNEAIDAYGPSLKRVRRYLADNAGGRTWSTAAVARVYAQQLERRRWARRDAREAEKARALDSAALKRKSRSIAGQAAQLHRRGDKRAPVFQRLAGIYAAEEARRAPPDQLTTHEQWAHVGAEYDQAHRELKKRAHPIARAARLAETPARGECSSPEPTPGTFASLYAAAQRIAAAKEATHG